jgi:membrane protein insertase Oxa1/YidC/SpoIIIJ
MMMILIPRMITIVFALKFASALALYWVASNCFSAMQTIAVHCFLDRRIRSGAVKI